MAWHIMLEMFPYDNFSSLLACEDMCWEKCDCLEGKNEEKSSMSSK